MIQAMIDFDEFKDYLASNPDMKFERRDTCRCPIAQFVTKKTGKRARVFSREVELVDSEGKFVTEWHLPWWAHNFIVQVDTSRTGLSERTITAEEALKILMDWKE